MKNIYELLEKQERIKVYPAFTWDTVRKGRKSWAAKLTLSKSEDTTQCHNRNLRT
jgi:hypothetical protein